MKRSSRVALVLAIGFLFMVAVIPARAEIIEKSEQWKKFCVSIRLRAGD